MNSLVINYASEIAAKNAEYIIGRMAQHCESPIENALGAALLIVNRIGLMSGVPLALISQDQMAGRSPSANLLVPQFRWKSYRSDFLMRCADLCDILIECDGHDYHERTKEQAARDRARDRQALAAGYYVLRFTGSEINRDPVACAYSVFNFTETLYSRKAART